MHQSLTGPIKEVQQQFSNPDVPNLFFSLTLKVIKVKTNENLFSWLVVTFCHHKMNIYLFVSITAVRHAFDFFNFYIKQLANKKLPFRRVASEGRLQLF